MNNLESVLHVRIESFSYKCGLPVGDPAHGGGFVFDCRCLPNPGRQEEYKQLTGRDASVRAFLDAKAEVAEFRSHTFALVDLAVVNYRSRNFEHLSVAYGCTGGQHRSVYFAELLSAYLSNREGIYIEVRHREYPV